ncbi:MAG: hypothetical protein H8Z69_04925 [Nanohaloarchaea archaeon]|nr:hypothetical protein [Candidatus Nanohaloarchaea archaeon]
MKRQFFCITMLLVCSTASSAALENVEQVNNSNLAKHEVVIGENQEIRWAGYEAVYKDSRDYSAERITFTDPDGVLMKQFSGEEFYDAFSEIKRISENLYLRLDSLNHDKKEIKATVWAPGDEFGSSDLNITAPEYIVKQNDEDFTVPIRIENSGGIEEAYELSAESSSPISTYFTYQGYNITKLVVEPGEEKEITADIELDEDIGKGVKKINFSVFNRSFSSKEFRFQVTNSSEDERELRMNLDENYLEKSSGTTVETTVRVENIGDSLVKNVEPSISTPENWNYTVKPEETKNISSEEFQDFELAVSVPSTATSGDYFVDIELENTENFDKRNVRVNVSDSSGGFGLIGAILALMSIMLVAGVYKVFGRR